VELICGRKCIAAIAPAIKSNENKLQFESYIIELEGCFISGRVRMDFSL
jgi:uncharacterized membrane protein YadS